MRVTRIILICTIMFLLPCMVSAQLTPTKDKVAVMITDWGMPAGYNFEYAYHSHDYSRIGDLTLYPGQPCKIGHVGEFPHEMHMGLVPWVLTASYPGTDALFDSYGIYKLENGIYVNVNPEVPSVRPDMIPAGVPITPVIQVISAMTGELSYPPDPRTGEDLLAGWYMVGSSQAPFPNGACDMFEGSCLTFMRYYGIMGGPTEPPESNVPAASAEAIMASTRQQLEASFGDRIDVRFGMYEAVKGYSEHEMDVAQQFVQEGFTKMLLSRETTDHNRYANEFFTGNYVKERLCELGVLDNIELYQTRQVGRTPEFNAMNIINLKPFIEAFPEGSTIAMIYVTRGLNWPAEGASGHPWCNEVYHENAYLNYISWKKALKNAFNGRYNLVFTRAGVESDLLDDNFYSYGVTFGKNLGGHFKSIRDNIQAIKEDGINKMIVAPCHWYYDNFDNILVMREPNKIPIAPKADLEAGKYDLTYCEDAAGNQVSCGSANAAATITAAPSYSGVGQLFATAYYVVLRGTLERFNLFPRETSIRIAASQLITKQDGGVVEAAAPFSMIKGARIEIPKDPYPERPQTFTPETAIPINDPKDTNDCMWEDTVINIGQQLNPPAMKSARSAGPAVHFGPYRNFFNRDVTITIPYRTMLAGGKEVHGYIYNHVTGDWDEIKAEKAESGLVTFKTQVLGLFRAGVAR
jgi:hypothetical protein